MTEPSRLLDESFTLPLSPPPEESRVWLDRVAPLLDGVAENVVDVCFHGFNEMLNNAVDHSGGATVVIRVVRTAADIEIRIADDRFSAPLEEDYGFTRTRVPVALARHAEEKLISRLQAKRLFTRFDRFKEVLLDFTGVQTIGQAFADEVFRVFADMHPAVHLTWTGAVPEVERMIRRAVAARSAPQGPP